MAQAEAALTEAWQTELERVQGQAQEKAGELEAQVVRLMTQIEDTRREEARTVGGRRQGGEEARMVGGRGWGGEDGGKTRVGRMGRGGGLEHQRNTSPHCL